MPLIPEANFGPTQISTNVGETPTQSVESAGMVTEAWGKVANNVAQLGVQLTQKRQEAKEKDFLNTESANYSVALADQDIQLKKTYASNPTGYAKAKKDFSDKYNQEALKRAPDDNTRAKWQQLATSKSDDIYNHALTWENKTSAEIISANRINNIDKTVGRIAITLDPKDASLAYNEALKINNDSVGLSISEADRIEQQPKIADKAAVTYVEGLMNSPKNKMSNLRRAQAFLDGKDVDTINIHKDMTSDTLLNLKKKVTTQIDSENKISKTMVGNKVKDVIAFAMNGNEIKQDELTFALKNAGAIDDGGASANTIKTAAEFSQEFQQIKSLPLNEMRAKAAQSFKLGDSSYNYADRQKLRDGFLKRVDKYIADTEKFPGKAFVANDSTGKNLEAQALDVEDPNAFQQYSARLKSYKQANNISGTALLTPDLASNYSNVIKMAKDGTGKDTIVQRLAANAGTDASQMLSELVSNEAGSQFTSTDFVISKIQNDSVRQNLYHNLMHQKDIPKIPDDAKKSIDSTILSDSTYKNFVSSMTGQGFDRRTEVDAYNKLIKIQATSRVNAGEDPDEATKNAVNDVLSGTKIVSKGNSNIVLAGDSVEYEQKVSDFVGVTANQNTMQALLKGGVSDSYYNNLKAAQKDLGFSKENISKKRAEYIAKRGRYVLDSSGANLMLITDDPVSGLPVPVRDAKDEVVKVPLTQLDTKLLEIRKASVKTSQDNLKLESEKNLSRGPSGI